MTTTETTALTPVHEVNALAVHIMENKALCAYANWITAKKHIMLHGDDYRGDTHCAALLSEYEATVRCIELLVTDSIYAIQQHIVGRFEHEFTF